MNVRHGDHTHEVTLEDDGTLDTVIQVDGQECRFSQEYGAAHRDADGSMTMRGLRALGLEACEDGSCTIDNEQGG